MKKIVLIFLVLLYLLPDAFTQLCSNVERFESAFPVTGLYQHYPDIQMLVPGQTLQDKADSCLAQLGRQFPNEFDQIETVFHSKVETPWFTNIEYRQLIDGIWLKNRGIGFQFDPFGNLVAINSYLEADPEVLEDLFELASGGSPSTHFIQNNGGIYSLHENLPPHVDAEPPGEGMADAIFKITSAPYAGTCLSNVEDITVHPGDVPLGTSGSNRLHGIYANPSPLPALDFEDLPQLDCTDGDCDDEEEIEQRHELLMCYHYLNQSFHYMRGKLEPMEFMNMRVPTDVTFDAFVAADFPIPGAKVTSEGHIDFGANCNPNSAFRDIAEDADYVIAAAFSSYIITNTGNFPDGDNEGVGLGMANFWTWQYLNRDLGQNEDEHFLLGKWAGPQPTPIDMVSGTLQQDGSVTNKLTYEVVLDQQSNYREKISIWAATLRDIYVEALDNDEVAMDILLLGTLALIGNKDVTQPEAVGFLYQAALTMPNQIEDAEMAEIECILQERYPYEIEQVQIWPENLPYFIRPNLYIKDTRLTFTPFPFTVITGEDLGGEKNLNSRIYDKSPSIWNCHGEDCFQHEEPVFGSTDYVRVYVSPRGCGPWPAITGEVEVYAAYTALNERWPADWDNAYYYYQGHYIQVGKLIGSVDLAEYDLAPDGIGRIYTIPWEPWNPWSVKQVPPPINFLARIVSTQDPDYPLIPDPEGQVSAWQYVMANNNVARRKFGFSLFAEGYPIPTPSPIPFMKSSIILGERTGLTQNFFLEFGYVDDDFIHTASNFDSLGLVKLVFPSNFMDTYNGPPPAGNDLTWVSDSSLIITGPAFSLPLNMDPDSMYPVEIQYIPIGTFQPVTFRFDLADDSGCNYGGETFLIDTVNIAPRSVALQDKRNLIKAIPNPATSEFTVELDNPARLKQIIVFNPLGQPVFISTDNPSSKISTGSWPDGLYFTKVILKDGSIEIIPIVKTQ